MGFRGRFHGGAPGAAVLSIGRLRMNTNRKTLENLFRTGGIDLVRGELFDRPPAPLPEGFDFTKVEGMLLGLVIGEALGMTTEEWLPDKRRATYGEVRDYLPGRHGDTPIGLNSDDMQLAFSTVEQMLEDDGFYPERVAEHFCRRHIFGRGVTVRRFLANRKSGLPWYQCGPKSSRNGALVRIAPMVVPHLKSPSTDLWDQTALCAMITHNDAGSTAACLAMVSMLWELLAMDGPPEPRWWLDRYVETARSLEGDTKHRARGGRFVGYEGPIWQFVREKVPEAHDEGLSVLEACAGWGSGPDLLETIPSVLYVLMRHGTDAEEAIVRAVNDTEDNDTVAALVGAAVGALYGTDGIPARWISNLPEHPAQQEEGTVFDLLGKARGRWWS